MPVQTINVNSSPGPATSPGFSQIQPTSNVGPAPVMNPNQTLTNNVVPVNEPVTVATWKVMDKFDSGLKTALLSFIDTTREGVKVPQNLKGRTKIIDFVFVGTSTQSVAPGEIGTFSLVMSYPPGANTVTNGTTFVSSTSSNTAFTGTEGLSAG